MQAVGKGVIRSPVNKRLEAEWLIPIVVALASACGDPAYKFVNVPHCKVADGATRSGFSEGLVWLYTSGNMHGSGPLIGDWPFLSLGVADAVSAKQTVLAVIACPKVAANAVTTVSSDIKTLADGLTEKAVPAVCPGQQVLFHDTLTATDDPAAKAKGYDGVLRFPEITSRWEVGSVWI